MPEHESIKSDEPMDSDAFDVNALCSSLTSYLDDSSEQMQLKHYIVAYGEIYK